MSTPNIIFFITDQERRERHWPAGWSETNLPTLQRLKKNGLTFNHYIAAACECSPSRASMMTSTYPQENGVTVTFATPLNPSTVNLAAVLDAVKIPLYWKGKWHLSHPLSGNEFSWSASDIANVASLYNVLAWNPPDAGNSLGSDFQTLGAGVGMNDARFVTGSPAGPISAQSAIECIQSYDPSSGPFCLVVSLVNPHDVWVYPQYLSQSGYTLAQFQNAGISLPSNLHDDLLTKPCAQLEFRKSYAHVPDADRLNYVNFYAWLHTLSDALFGQVMDALDTAGLTDDTIIFRFADHGEMGLSHGLQEKMYTAYEEAINVPLIISNPKLFPSPMVTNELASGIDIAPTVAALCNSTTTSTLRGVSLVPLFTSPSSPVRKHAIYTFDDQFGISSGATHIRCIRTKEWKYAVYLSDNPTGTNVFEYELYDLAHDPGELTNLAFGTVTPATLTQWTKLHAQLTSELRSVAALPNITDWPAAPPTSWTRCPS
ncbi:MAG TPA: sulfatase-like hydrolase/transferase [Thermoanaerobaculia bacterium]|jgi:choline-sulfatase|nr:sulfatase-like hydrolase/transferase [Thermoanaerobaculia bacterium]